MKYIGKTLHFLNRNFFYLLVFCLVPAVLIVADFDVAALVGLFACLWSGGEGFTPAEIFAAMTFLFKPTYWLAIIVIVVLLFSVCLCFFLHGSEDENRNLLNHQTVSQGQ